MPQLASYADKHPIKMLVIGDSGKGKTGALFCLAQRGFRLRIADFDNGAVDVLQGIAAEKRVDLGKLDIDVEIFTDTRVLLGHKITVVKQPTAWERFLTKLNTWGGSGGIAKWGPDTILVIDSLSIMSRTALASTLVLNGRSGDQPYQSDWGDAMRQIEEFLTIIYSAAVPCHVIVTSHVTYVEEEGAGVTAAYPMAIGNKLSPVIPRYFNTMVKVDSKGSGDTRRSVILTKPDGKLGLKVPIPSIAKELPQDTGLQTIFDAMGWSRPPRYAEAPAPQGALTETVR